MPKAVNESERRQTWLAFASAAISGLGSDPEYKIDELIEDCVGVANDMLEEYLEKFEPGYERPDEDEDEDEEEEEEEEDEDEEEEKEKPRKRRK